MTINITGAVQLGNLMGGPSSISLSDLSDVSITAPLTGQYLRYNAGTDEWQNTFLNTDVYNFLTGHITGSNGVTLTQLSGPQNINIGLVITASGDAAGSLSGGNLALTLATTNSTPQSNTFRKVTINGKGLTTATSAVVPGDITTALGYVPVNVAGDTMGGFLLLNADPIAGLGAATKQYVDNVAAGLNAKAAARTSTTGANLTSVYDNGASGVGSTLTGIGTLPVIGGVSLVIDDRVLIKDQTSQLENGIYSVTTITPNWILTRTADFDNSPAGEVTAGSYLFVQEGTLAGTSWVEVTPDPIIVGTTAIDFSQFSGAGTYTAGTGLDLTGTTFSNTGVLSAIAGANISVSSATGNITIAVVGTVPTSGTAITLATPRTINGVAFDGSTNITVTSAAGTLTGPTLNSSVTASNLTSLGLVTALSAGTVSASSGFTGNLTGNVTGNITGTVTGHSTLDLALSGGTMSGLITSSSVEMLRGNSNGSFISGYNIGGTTRTGYLQFNSGSNIILAAEQSNLIQISTTGGSLILSSSGVTTASGHLLGTQVISSFDLTDHAVGSPGDIVARRSTTSGAYFFGDNVSAYLFFDGTNFNFGTGTVNSPSFTGTLIGNATGNSATATTAASCSGNSATATTAASCSGNSATATTASSSNGLNSGLAYTAIQFTGTSTLTSNGTITAGSTITAGGDIIAFSDSRLKDNVEIITHALDKVQAIRGVTFTRKDEVSQKRHVGVIAQEVEAVLPEAVLETDDGIKAVAYGNMTGLLIEAIKELRAEVAFLRDKVSKLEG